MIKLIIQIIIDIIIKAIPILLIFIIIKKFFNLNSFPISLIINISLLISTIYLLLIHVNLNIITQ